MGCLPYFLYQLVQDRMQGHGNSIAGGLLMQIPINELPVDSWNGIK